MPHRVESRTTVTLRSTSVILAVLMLLVPRDAFAYIDPGSSSMLLQAIVGGVAAVLMITRVYWRRATGLFRRSRGRDDA